MRKSKRNTRRRYYEQEYIQDSFLHSEESSEQGGQGGDYDPADRKRRNRAIQFQAGRGTRFMGRKLPENAGQFLESTPA